MGMRSFFQSLLADGDDIVNTQRADSHLARTSLSQVAFNVHDQRVAQHALFLRHFAPVVVAGGSPFVSGRNLYLANTSFTGDFLEFGLRKYQCGIVIATPGHEQAEE